jgi:RNA polymerase sigma factor (sigma-70 family)
MDHEQRGHRLAARHPTEGHDVYRDLRPLLLSIAYRMVGSYSEAEDLVQEAFVRFHEATRRGVEVESAKAFLTTVITRLAIDHLRSARVRRESYVGPWLPDPLVDEMAPDVARTAELAESLSTAFLVLLETLSPLERAVFLLRDVFAYDYGTIAGVRVAVAEPRFDPSLDERDRLAEWFFAASQRGDLTALVQMLARDAVFVGDGGTKGNGLARPVEGREQVGRLLVGFARRATAAEIRLQPIHVGGQPAALLVDADDGVVAVWSLNIVNGVVQEIHGVVNPDKLAHLGPVSPFAYRRQPRDPTRSIEQQEGHEDDHS